jgi:hypothetical protein
MSIPDRLELSGRLRRNDIVVTVKIEGALSLAVVGQEADSEIVLTFGVPRNFVAPTLESIVAKLSLEQICADKIVLSGRILRGNSNQLGNDGGDFVLTLL